MPPRGLVAPQRPEPQGAPGSPPASQAPSSDAAVPPLLCLLIPVPPEGAQAGRETWEEGARSAVQGGMLRGRRAGLQEGADRAPGAQFGQLPAGQRGSSPQFPGLLTPAPRLDCCPQGLLRASALPTLLPTGLLAPVRLGILPRVANPHL